MRNKFKQSIEAGTAFIIAQDLSSKSSAQQAGWRNARTYHTTFVPSLILHSLAEVNDPKLNDYKTSITSFLLGQTSDKQSFNYWDRTSPEAKQLPYPDDLDDTFCALIALHTQSPINGDQLAKIVQLLIATETKPGGPYRTWLTSDENPVWRDVDIAVNANIAYFLQFIGSPLPSLTNYLAGCILADKLDSPYYPSRFPVYYYLARVCPPSARGKLIEDILDQKASNSLQIALQLNALCLMNGPQQQITRLAKQLIDAQATNGSWPAAAYCYDPMRDGKKYYHGSDSLTTAFAVEALNRYQRQIAASIPSTKPVKGQRLHDDIIKQTKADIAKLPTDMQQPAQTLVNKLGKPEVTLLPYFFYHSLATAPKLPGASLKQLGLANLYGWIAYTIYDDFLDEEGNPLQLPVANWALRQSLLTFQTVSNKAFKELVVDTFNTIDGANAWEVSHCRWEIQNGTVAFGSLPNYHNRQKLAERSLGHYLGPMAILSSVVSLNDPRVVQIQQAFRHYLIARQLSDDAHDWQEDYERGQISYVVGHILAGLGYPQKSLKHPLISPMRQEFWRRSLPEICTTIQRHIDQGRRELKNNTLLRNKNFLLELFNGLETSVTTTRIEQKQTVNFLAQYKKSH